MKPDKILQAEKFRFTKLALVNEVEKQEKILVSAI